MIAAAFDHWDSRKGDPQLHTHVTIANRVQGPEGQWRTLDSATLHRAVVAYSETYNLLLADEVTRLWTVVESAVEDIVDGADGNRRLGRHGDGLVCDVTAVSLAW